jgi:hypothetical protein
MLKWIGLRRNECQKSRGDILIKARKSMPIMKYLMYRATWLEAAGNSSPKARELYRTAISM